MQLWCERAWLGGNSLATGVLLSIDNGVFTDVSSADSAPSGAEVARGAVLPGFANGHSHAFHRALRGRTHGGAGSFWTWREQMYSVAARLDPDSYLALATATFAEMVLCGYTAVGEFHYLHHAPGGVAYSDPNAMGAALIEAARIAGLRLTLLDTCYIRGGFDVELTPAQHRFSDGSVDNWAARNDLLTSSGVVKGSTRLGAAIHSVRALSIDDMSGVASWSASAGCPLHAHVSEQLVENQACLAHTGRTPSQLLADAGVVGRSFTAVHATHLSPDDIGILGSARATACFCCTTERDLADGVGPSRALADAGARLSIGSDSHAMIDPFEEIRGIESHQRLVTNTRGVHSPAELLAAGSFDGYASIGWNGGILAAGAVADLVVIEPASVRLAGSNVDDAASLVFGASAPDITQVMVDGRWVVRDGSHVSIDVPRALSTSIDALWFG